MNWLAGVKDRSPTCIYASCLERSRRNPSLEIGASLNIAMLTNACVHMWKVSLPFDVNAVNLISNIIIIGCESSDTISFFSCLAAKEPLEHKNYRKTAPDPQGLSGGQSRSCIRMRECWTQGNLWMRHMCTLPGLAATSHSPGCGQCQIKITPTVDSSLSGRRSNRIIIRYRLRNHVFKRKELHLAPEPQNGARNLDFLHSSPNMR